MYDVALRNGNASQPILLFIYLFSFPTKLISDFLWSNLNIPDLDLEENNCATSLRTFQYRQPEPRIATPDTKLTHLK